MSKQKPIIANKSSKIAHTSRRDDSCRAAEILQRNRITFQSEQEMLEAGYRRCKAHNCWPVEEEASE